MSNINDILFVGLGGAGGRLIDDLVEYNPIYQQLFINTSMTDLESLKSLNKVTNNYYCLGVSNGVGRKRELGKEISRQYGYNIIDLLNRYPQKYIYFTCSLGGGSGNSILSTILDALEELKKEGEFDKIINLILILPSLDSPDIILENTKESWNEIIPHQCINNMIFISNDSQNSNIIKKHRELYINKEFCKIFDSLFLIPEDNGIQFDTQNLNNILNDKGVLYFYELDNNCSSVEVAYEKAKKNSVLAPMFKNEINIKINPDGTTITKCKYLGISFNNKKYNIDYFTNNFEASKEIYIGNNIDTNLVLISGMLPPFDSINFIKHELETRNEKNNNNDIDFSQFTLSLDNNKENNDSEISVEVNNIKNRSRKLRKGLFKR